MPKYRTTICQDKGFSEGMFFYAPIDLRKKYYKCNHCQGFHLTKEGVVKEESVEPPSSTVTTLKE